MTSTAYKNCQLQLVIVFSVVYICQVIDWFCRWLSYEYDRDSTVDYFTVLLIENLCD